jgi:RND family efflux transporter MFP subunit
MKPILVGSLILSLTTLAACGGETDATPATQAPTVVDGTPLVLADTTLPFPTLASAVAEPLTSATLSTKLMGSVTEMLVQEGALVASGQVLARLDARDLTAKRAQVDAGIATAEAMRGEALQMATRIRALYADSAAPKMQLDAAEAGLARAEAGVRAARAGLDELTAISEYATIRAPFAGVVTQRFVDVGAMAAPGAPLLTVENHSQLRVVATVTPDLARGLQRGSKLDVTIEGVAATATVEGVVPAPGRSLTVVNALVANRDGALTPGGVASIAIPGAPRSVLLVPASAVRTEGDLTGVIVRSNGTDRTRWITLGRTIGSHREVLGGVVAGDTIIVPEN